MLADSLSTAFHVCESNIRGESGVGELLRENYSINQVVYEPHSAKAIIDEGNKHIVLPEEAGKTNYPLG